MLTADPRVQTTYHFPHTRRNVLFQQTPFWYVECPRSLPEANEVILEGLEGIVYLIDDLGKNQAEHDQRLMAVMKGLKVEKHAMHAKQREMQFNQRSVNFVGNLIEAWNMNGSCQDCHNPGDEGPVKRNGAQTIHGDGESIGKFTPHIYS